MTQDRHTARYAGLAPLGTALTDHQVALLRPHLHPDRPAIIATDADRAGQQAAHRAYWKLTDGTHAPRALRTSGADGQPAKDPAELLQQSGAAGLRAALDSAGPFATSVIDDRLAAHDGTLRWAEGRLAAVRDVAPLIAALPVSDWPGHIDAVTRHTGLPHPQVVLEVLEASRQRHTDPAAVVARQLAHPVPERPALPDPAAAWWSALAERVLPGLTQDPHWPALAAALERAHRVGYDVNNGLPEVIAQRPLPEQRVGLELHAPLAVDCDAARTPTSPDQREQQQAAARTRRRDRTPPRDTPTRGRGR